MQWLYLGEGETVLLWQVTDVPWCLPSTVETIRNSDKECMMSFQGHRRKNWKVRKFVVRDDPAFMHYYDPAKVNIGLFFFFYKQSFFIFLSTLASASFLIHQNSDPLGSIHLRGSVVTAVEYVPDGEWDPCHRIHIPYSTSLLCQTLWPGYTLVLYYQQLFSPSPVTSFLCFRQKKWC